MRMIGLAFKFVIQLAEEMQQKSNNNKNNNDLS